MYQPAQLASPAPAQKYAKMGSASSLRRRNIGCPAWAPQRRKMPEAFSESKTSTTAGRPAAAAAGAPNGAATTAALEARSEAAAPVPLAGFASEPPKARLHADLRSSSSASLSSSSFFRATLLTTFVLKAVWLDMPSSSSSPLRLARVFRLSSSANSSSSSLSKRARSSRSSRSLSFPGSSSSSRRLAFLSFRFFSRRSCSSSLPGLRAFFSFRFFLSLTDSSLPLSAPSAWRRFAFLSLLAFFRSALVRSASSSEPSSASAGGGGASSKAPPPRSGGGGGGAPKAGAMTFPAGSHASPSTAAISRPGGFVPTKSVRARQASGNCKLSLRLRKGTINCQPCSTTRNTPGFNGSHAAFGPASPALMPVPFLDWSRMHTVCLPASPGSVDGRKYSSAW
mmetsp:Transcript_79992/g.232246  ORF Transcript_79992/g.232246 Transcript_79992/m.232246 type:complete len:396 (-) Transcript_79992:233-1420(-)